MLRCLMLSSVQNMCVIFLMIFLDKSQVLLINVYLSEMLMDEIT